MKLCNYILLTILAAMLAGCVTGETVNLSKHQKKIKSIIIPELKSICQKFIRSMLFNNKEGVKSVILPAENAELLWQGEAPPKGMLEKIETSIKNMVITELKVGDTVKLPNGKSFVIKKEMLGKDKKMILMKLGGEKMPIPFVLQKVNGSWKIDASPIIAARKAAAKVRAKNKTEKK